MKWWKCVISSSSFLVFKECYYGIDGQGCSALHPSDSCLTKRGRNDIPIIAHTGINLKQVNNYLLTDALLLSLTQPALNYVCKCVYFTHNASKSTHIHALSLFKVSDGDGAQEPQRLVSSHVGSFMLFKTLLTTFSRSFRALCSSSNDLFIFLVSCCRKQVTHVTSMCHTNYRRGNYSNSIQHLPLFQLTFKKIYHCIKQASFNFKSYIRYTIVIYYKTSLTITCFSSWTSSLRAYTTSTRLL